MWDNGDVVKKPEKKPKNFMRFMKRHSKSKDTPYLAGGVVISLCSIVSIVLFGASWVQYIANSSNNFAAVISAVLVDLANADRAALADAGALAVNETLAAAAQAKADHMAQNGYFAHVSPDGREPWVWIKDAGYDYQYAGENLAVRFGDSIEVERAWLASPTHRANILDRRFTEVGIATAYGMYQGQPTTFVVQMFGAPKKKAAPPAAPRVEIPAPVPAPNPAAPASAIALADGEGSEEEADPTVLGAAEAAEITVEYLEPEASPVAHVMASPKTYARYAYAVLAVLGLLAGAYALYFEIRQKHFKHGSYAVALSFALLAFLYMADAVMFAGPEVARAAFPLSS